MLTNDYQIVNCKIFFNTCSNSCITSYPFNFLKIKALTVKLKLYKVLINTSFQLHICHTFMITNLLIEKKLMKTSNLLLTFMCLLIAFTGISQEKYFTSSTDTKSYSIMDLVESDKNFSMFYKFLRASGIDTNMTYVDGYTLFIPVNDAFGEMKLQKLFKLTDDGNQVKLAEFVKSYILPNKVYESEFKDNHVINFEEDNEILVNSSNRTTTIGGAQIIQSDIEAKDGIIHVIEELILSNDY